MTYRILVTTTLLEPEAHDKLLTNWRKHTEHMLRDEGSEIAEAGRLSVAQAKEILPEVLQDWQDAKGIKNKLMKCAREGRIYFISIRNKLT